MTKETKNYPTPKSFRFDQTTTSMLEALKQKFGVSQADIVRLGIRKLYEAEITETETKPVES